MTKIYDMKIKFPVRSLAVIVGGHPEGGLVITEGVVIDTLDESKEPYYQCHVTGNPRAVYPYTDSRKRIFSQSELAEPRKGSKALDTLSPDIINALFGNVI
jgi:hypothetical protein